MSFTSKKPAKSLPFASINRLRLHLEESTSQILHSWARAVTSNDWNRWSWGPLSDVPHEYASHSCNFDAFEFRCQPPVSPFPLLLGPSVYSSQLYFSLTLVTVMQFIRSQEYKATKKYILSCISGQVVPRKSKNARDSSAWKACPIDEMILGSRNGWLFNQHSWSTFPIQYYTWRLEQHLRHREVSNSRKLGFQNNKML